MSIPVNLKCRKILPGSVRFLNREVGHFSANALSLEIEELQLPENRVC